MIPFKIIRKFISIIDPIKICPEEESDNIYRFRKEIPDTWDEYYVSSVHVREDRKYEWEGLGLNYLEIHLKKENDVQTPCPFTMKDLKPYISTINRISVCDSQTLCYENYGSIEYVGEEYDNMYAYGFGPRLIDWWDKEHNSLELITMLEIMISKEPREDMKVE